MEDHGRILDFLERRERARQSRLHGLFRAAWEDFDRIVAMIVEEHHPRRIWQWGSLLDRRKFTERSDLDLAVEGLASAADFFRLAARAEGLTDFPLDIVEMEKIASGFRALIQSKGRLVHGHE